MGFTDWLKDKFRKEKQTASNIVNRASNFVRQTKQTYQTPQVQRQVQRVVQSKPVQMLRGAMSPELSMTKQRLLGGLKLANTAAGIGNRINPMNAISSVRNQNMKGLNASRSLVNRNKPTNLAEQTANFLGEQVGYVALPMSKGFEATRIASPIKRFAANNVLRGVENAAFQAAPKFAEGQSVEKIVKESPKDILFGALANTALSPKTTIKAFKSIENERNLYKFAGKMDKEPSRTMMTSLGNKSPVNIKYASNEINPNLKTIEVPNEVAGFYGEKGRFPAKGEVVPQRFDTKGTATMHFDARDNTLIGWKTDNPTFAKQVQDNKIQFGLSTREVKPSEGNAKHPLPTGEGKVTGSNFADIDTIIKAYKQNSSIDINAVRAEYKNNPAILKKLDIAQAEVKVEKARKAVETKRYNEYAEKLNALANKTRVMDDSGTLNTQSIRDFHKAEYELAKQYPDISPNPDKIAYYEKTYGIPTPSPITPKTSSGVVIKPKGTGTPITPKPPLTPKTEGAKTLMPELPQPTQPKIGIVPKLSTPQKLDVSLTGTITPEQKIVNAIKGAKPLSQEQKVLTSKLRGQQFAKMMSARGRTTGEKGYFAELGALKGGAKKVDFEAIRPQLEQGDIDSLFNKVNDANIGEWEKINAKASLSKLLAKEGATIPTQNELKLLNDVFGSDFTKAILDKRSTWQKLMSGAGEALNLPRSMMASFDLSAPLRQGVFLVGRPKQWIPAFTSMFKQFGSEKAYKAVQESIQAMPNYKTMRQARLAITDVGSIAGGREELFMSNLAEKVPVIGKGVRASGRAYTGFLNKLRADVFNDLYTKAKTLGQDSPEMADDIAKFVNSATGRGDLGKLNNAATALNSVFFSPRLMASRVNLLNPAYYAQLNPMVRKEALKSLLTFGAVAGSTLALAKAGGADVGTDPRSADFGKIKVGDTRYDILGGFQQYIVLASRLLTGKMVSSTTGKEISLTEGYKPTTRKDILVNFLQSKENPVLSYVTNWLEGTTQLGQKFRPIPELIDRFVPMLTQDLVELAEDKGFTKAIGMTLPAVFGTGVQTYGKQIPNVNKKGKLEWRNPPSIGERIYNKVTGQQISNIPLDQQKTLSDQHRVELQNKADVEKVKAQIMKAEGGSASVGDKTVYWDEDSREIKVVPKQKYNLLQFEKQNGENDTLKAQYTLDYQRAKRNKDLDKYMEVSQARLDYLENYKQLLDPKEDAKKLITIANEQDDILYYMNQYAGYGGFTKGKSGGKGKKAKALKQIHISTSLAKPKFTSVKMTKPSVGTTPSVKLSLKKGTPNVKFTKLSTNGGKARAKGVRKPRSKSIKSMVG